MSQAAPHRIAYKASPTLSAFHRSEAFYRGVMGPVGSGKSTGMCFELFRRATEQAKSPIDGKRKSRFCVVRNTYRELKDTTLKTWLDWFGPLGSYSTSDNAFIAHFGDVELEILFRALDRPDDVKKLLSLELTGGWVNEAKEIPKSIIDTLGDRVGRYPSMRDGGCTWSGVFMDTNPPDDGHWWYVLAEEPAAKLSNWEFFRQPGGLIERDGQFIPNPEAENLENLPADYYVTRQEGKKPDYIRVYYCSQYGFTKEGKQVIPEYVDDLHCAKEPFHAVAGLPIRIGIDWGLTPAATFGQRLANGRWIVFHEVTTEHMGAQKFGQLVAQHINEHFSGFTFEAPSGDPAGMAGVQTDERTVFAVFNEALRLAGVPIVAEPAPTNDPVLRHGAMSAVCSRLIDGKPGFLISPACKTLRKGLAGGYCYKRVMVPGEERYQDKPDKNRFSHVVESCEYMLVGAGEGAALIAPAQEPIKPFTFDFADSGASWMGA